MADDGFSDNLIRLVAAQLHVLIGLTASREMFGKSYFSLGAPEKIAVDQAVIGMVGGNYQAITPQYLAGQTAQQPVGFQAPANEQP
jgi:hypothetical protein